MVAVIVGGLGFFGCAQVVVADAAGESVTNATVEVNSATLVYNTDFGTYGDDDGNLDYDTGEIYNLTVTVGNTIIAEGMARMPTQPEVSSPADSANHQLNQSLTLHINDIAYDDEIVISLHTPLYDADGNSQRAKSHVFSFGSNSITVTLPDSVFAVTGWYQIYIYAISGWSGDMATYNPDSLKLGYNIQGPKGIFIATAAGRDIRVLVPSLSSTPAIKIASLEKGQTDSPLAKWEKQWRRRWHR